MAQVVDKIMMVVFLCSLIVAIFFWIRKKFSSKESEQHQKFSNYKNYSLIVAVISVVIAVIVAPPSEKQNSPSNSTQNTQTVKQVETLTPAEEKIVYQNFKQQIQRGLVAVDNDWDTLWSPTIQNMANGLINDQTAFAKFRELEQNLINDEMIIYNAYNSVYDNIPSNKKISQDTENKMKQITDEFQQWIQQRRHSSENFRQALGMGQISEAKIQETITMINRADGIMQGAIAKLAQLDDKFK